MPAWAWGRATQLSASRIEVRGSEVRSVLEVNARDLDAALHIALGGAGGQVSLGVAPENFFVRDIRRRWRVTFAFGLVHGFGFAGVLREYGLPRDALALAAFNLGVEIGQVTIVLLALAILRAIEALVRLRAGGALAFPDARFVHTVS